MCQGDLAVSWSRPGVHPGRRWSSVNAYLLLNSEAGHGRSTRLRRMRGQCAFALQRRAKAAARRDVRELRPTRAARQRVQAACDPRSRTGLNARVLRRPGFRKADNNRVNDVSDQLLLDRSPSTTRSRSVSTQILHTSAGTMPGRQAMLNRLPSSSVSAVQARKYQPSQPRHNIEQAIRRVGTSSVSRPHCGPCHRQCVSPKETPA